MTEVRVERDALARTWSRAPGLGGWLTAANHKQIGARFIVTAIVFFLLGGLLALLIRTQLAVADNDLLGPEAYNQIFTMHGTTMMFLFAVPILEGLAIYFVPLMIGTRDLPFPRLNSFGYYAYLFGGLFVYSSFLFGVAPDGGWFSYVPLTGPEFSPGLNLDFWLLGVTLVEISGIVGAIELIVVILTQRAPGMSIARMPLFVWASLVMAFMMLFAFTPLVAASILLEADRALGFQVYDPTAGGDPLLWQHLFWFFGHPEVYIMLIPATGIVSTVVPALSRRPILGYRWIVTALVAIGVLSFGLWVHHMFTTGIPLLGMSFFAVASFAIAVPSGIQVFAWLGTLWEGRPRFDTPMLFVLGFLVLFVMGGVTGVMVASIPFDQQVHDSFFVVAHFHYVLVGGVVFPILGGLHYWFPKMSGRMPSELLGKWAFWLSFLGFNLTFLIQHYLGLIGMPRRVYTYRGGLGWEPHNLVSTLGSYLLGIGFLVFVLNLARAALRGPPAGADPWEANTLEWSTASPPDPYNFLQVPVVGSADPLWDPAPEPDPDSRQAIADLDLPDGSRRRVLVTSPVEGRIEGAATLPAGSWSPLLVAVGLVVALLGLLLKFSVLGLAGAALTLGSLLVWLWSPAVEEVPR